MYEKMIQIDPNAPTEEEHQAKGKHHNHKLFYDFNTHIYYRSNKATIYGKTLVVIKINFLIKQ